MEDLPDVWIYRLSHVAKKTVLTLVLALAALSVGTVLASHSASETTPRFIPAAPAVTVDGNHDTSGTENWTVPSTLPVTDTTNLDWYGHMFRAGNVNKPIEADLFLRYQCPPSQSQAGTPGTLYAFVHAVPGVVIVKVENQAGFPGGLTNNDDHFLKIDTVKEVDADDEGNVSTPPDFDWHESSSAQLALALNFAQTFIFDQTLIANGWEASIALAPGNHTIQAHTNVFDSETQTASTAVAQSRDIPLDIDSSGPAPPPTGTIIINLDTVPDDGQDFGFSTTGGLTPSPFTLDDDGTESNPENSSITFSTLAAGPYTVTQGAEAGFTLTGLSCTAGGVGVVNTLTATITLGPGATVTCTFTNNKDAPPPPPTGTIIINLDTVPDDGQDFGFSTTGGLTPSPFTLDDDGTESNPENSSITFSSLAAGPYTVTQGAEAGFTLTGLSCSTGGVGDVNTLTATITLAQGQTVTCTFTNNKAAPPPTGTIIINLDTVPDDGQDFGFNTTGGLTPSPFTLDDDGAESNPENSSITFSSLAAGPYTVTQGAEAGFTLTGLSCTAGGVGDVNTLEATITLGPGEIVTCTFTNNKDAGALFIIIDEDGIDNGLTPFVNDEDVPGFTTAEAVNDDVAEIGVRAQLRFFAANVGQTITLRTGEVGDEGWFVLTEDPPQWAAAGGVPAFVGDAGFLPEVDPPHGVGPGLGAEDVEGDREALLDKIDGVTPLRFTGLSLLVGKDLCAVVYDSDVSINYDDPINGSLKGANYGTVAFNVISVTALDENVDENVSSSSLPKAFLRILDAEVVCGGPLILLFTEAPELESSSEPFDVAP